MKHQSLFFSVLLLVTLMLAACKQSDGRGAQAQAVLEAYSGHVHLFDMDPAVATESRLCILAYAREHGLRMYGHHLPAPGYIE